MMFTDVQKAPPILLKTIIGIAAISTLFCAGIVVLFQIDDANQHPSAWGAVVGLALLHVVLVVLFANSILTVRLSSDGVHLRFRPFQRKGRTISWTDVDRIVVRKVNAFGEFGGWGIRWNLYRSTGYVWNSKTGIELFLRSGKRVVVTIADIEGARHLLNTLVTERIITATVDDRLITLP